MKRSKTQNRSQSNTVRLTRAMRGIPASRYRLSGDGAKWKSLCQQRKQLADWLASYGDGDGTRIFPKIETILAAFDTRSRKTLFRRLADLRALGILVPEGLRGERGPRVRRLVPGALTQPKPEVSNSRAEVSDGCNKASNSPASEVSNGNPEVSDGNPEVSNLGDTTLPTPDRHLTVTTTKPPKPPTDKTGGGLDGEELWWWHKELLAIRRGRKKRLPNLEEYLGAPAHHIRDLLLRLGFAARLVTEPCIVPVDIPHLDPVARTRRKSFNPAARTAEEKRARLDKNLKMLGFRK